VANALITPSVAVMFVAPCFCPVATPPPLIEAIAGAEDIQLTELVRSKTLLSLYVPNALNCVFWPAATLAAVGDTVRVTKTGGPTLNDADPWIPAELAAIFAAPCRRARATPPLPTDATSGVSDVHDALDVRS
jgi:hypothetical protein